MKRYLLLFICVLCMASGFAQSMTDQQVVEYIAREHKAGKSQSQIMTALVQRGVNVDQIRRLKKKYDKQLKERGITVSDDGTVTRQSNKTSSSDADDNDIPKRQDLNTAKVGTSTAVRTNANENIQTVENDVQAMSEINEGTGKKIFGHDIFNNNRLTFEPSMNMATPQNYVLGPGDQVVVNIYGASQLTHRLIVSPDGLITVPNFGPIAVSGLSVTAAQSKIRSSLGSRYASSNIKLTLDQTRSIMVNVMGEVMAPGTYTLSGYATVFHALYSAGGINDLGTLRNIKVYRQGKLVTIVDIYEYILNGRLAGNIRLQDNDVIQVGPYDCLVGITGNVKRTMFYEMRKNESVATLIKYAGGFTGDAYTKAIRLIRQNGERYSVFNINEFDFANFQVADGDAVTVDGMLNRFENMVEVKGAVFRPAQYQLGGNITTVKSLIEAAEGVTEDAFTVHAVMHRMKADRSLEIIPVDVQGILNGTVADIPLKNEDVLFIPTQTELRNLRTLTITGEVLSPGEYEYADNTTIEDLIIQAGGLKDEASTARVDVSRRIIDTKSKNKTKEIAKSFTFSLKDGLVIDGERGFLLEPYDVVHVRRSPGFHTPRSVMVEGEVNFEGNFTLEKKNQRLSDLIAAAGGVTDDAYIKGARLMRQMSDDERSRMQTILNMARAQEDDKDTIMIDQLALEETYPVGIHLDKALENPGGSYDITLREGDRLIIPEYNGTVRISGNVMFPNTVAYEEGKNYKYFVNQAGGFGNRAKKSKTYIVYQNGTVSQVGHGTKVEPGCEIVVPTKAKRNAMGLTQWLSVGTSLTSIAAMVATLANALK